MTSPASSGVAAPPPALSDPAAASPPEDEAPAAAEPEGPSAVPSREEEHLYLQLQRFSFCLDRHAARRSDAPRPPEPDGEDLVDTVSAARSRRSTPTSPSATPARICRSRGCAAGSRSTTRRCTSCSRPRRPRSISAWRDGSTLSPAARSPTSASWSTPSPRDLAEERRALAALRATGTAGALAAGPAGHEPRLVAGDAAAPPPGDGARAHRRVAAR